MKNKLSIISIITVILFIVNSCAALNEVENKELFIITDKFVESLYTTYESYGLLNGPKELTPDGNYQVFPVGRLINVKIMTYVDPSEYSKLVEKLKTHYKDNYQVKNVYINNGGTVMIDCRK